MDFQLWLLVGVIIVAVIAAVVLLAKIEPWEAAGAALPLDQLHPAPDPEPPSSWFEPGPPTRLVSLAEMDPTPPTAAQELRGALLQQSIYDRAGGRDAVRMVVEALYAAILADPELAPLFVSMHLGRIKIHMMHLMSILLGAQGRDAEQSWEALSDGLGVQPAGGTDALGRMLVHKHFGLSITDAMFDRTAGYLGTALTQGGVPGPDTMAVLRTVETFRLQVVEHPR